MSFLKNRTVVGVICIMLSLLICFGLTPLFNQSLSQKAEIVRVVQPIRAGDEITESMVQTVEVGGYNLPEDVLRQKESAVGKYATADLAVGDYIIPSKLSDAPAAENAYLYLSLIHISTPSTSAMSGRSRARGNPTGWTSG